MSKGALLILSYKPPSSDRLFLVGSESSYLSENKHALTVLKYKGKNLYDAYLSPGSINSVTAATIAKTTFDSISRSFDNTNPEFGHITYDKPKNSSKKGFISAKPRYVPVDKRGKYGFPKGGILPLDKGDVKNTVIRECYEETNILIEKRKLRDIGKKNDYTVFHYEASDEEFSLFTALIIGKNTEYENELQDIRFSVIPKTISGRNTFFINDLSKKAYDCI